MLSVQSIDSQDGHCTHAPSKPGMIRHWDANTFCRVTGLVLKQPYPTLPPRSCALPTVPSLSTLRTSAPATYCSVSTSVAPERPSAPPPVWRWWNLGHRNTIGGRRAGGASPHGRGGGAGRGGGGGSGGTVRTPHPLPSGEATGPYNVTAMAVHSIFASLHAASTPLCARRVTILK